MTCFYARYFAWILLLALSLNSNIVLSQDETHSYKNEIQLLNSQHHADKVSHSIISKQLSYLIANKPKHFDTYLLDQHNNLVSVELERSNVSKKQLKNVLYYQGRIKDGTTSLVTLTVRQNSISGIISDKEGNFKYSTRKNGSVYIQAKSKQAQESSWECHSTPALDNYADHSSYKSYYKSTNSDTIGIFFVCDYNLFELQGFSHQATLDYVYDLFHQVQALYAIDNITIQISDIQIWDTPDPFDESSNEAALLSFRDQLGGQYDGHLAHLLSASPVLSGGIGFINGLCNRTKSYSYSNVDAYIDQQGGYSWDVHVVAHEIGHNLGSQHTHDCVWGPDGNDAIDACGEPAPECDDAPIPVEGGTIMSYCHTRQEGVNFSLGFGPEPGQRMRETIQYCLPGDGESCAEAFVLSESGQFHTGPITSGSGASHSQSTHARWYRFEAPSNGHLSIQSCGQNVDTRLFIYSGHCSDLTEINSSDDDCFSGNGYNYASIIDDMFLTEGTSIYIEWDDRWESSAFEFTFSFIPEELGSCTNGIQDGDETGVDCGGQYCEPCMISCNDSSPLPENIDTLTTYASNHMINYQGSINVSAMLEVQSALGIEFDSGFTISEGGAIEVEIETCSDY